MSVPIDPRIPALVALVQSYVPVDDKAAQSRQQFLEFLATSPQPFSRNAHRHHVTASAIVVSSAGTLLHLHKIAGEWCGPGGHVDGDEWPAYAAVRETLEETGLVAWHPTAGPLLAHLDVHGVGNGHTHYDLRYLLQAEPLPPCPPPGESPDVRWFPDEEAMAITDHSYRVALREAYDLSPRLLN